MSILERFDYRGIIHRFRERLENSTQVTEVGLNYRNFTLGDRMSHRIRNMVGS